MDLEELRLYCLSKKGVTEEFPFDKDTLVFKVMGKMFALIGLERIPRFVNIKCDPNLAVKLREEYDGLVIPGWHMSKTHWNSVFFEELPPSKVQHWINHSYEQVVSKMTKKMRETLQRLPD